MLIRLQRCGSGFVLEAHSKSFHSSVQIQWGCYVSPALSGWISCFPSLVQRQTGASGGLLLWNSHSTKCGMALRFSSLPNMQCVLSSLYLIICNDRGVCMCVHVCACMCARLWLHSCLKRGNIMYPISPSFHFASRGHLTELPSTFQLFYWAEMFSLAWHIAENPPNYTCHVAWSCPPWQYGLTKWFMLYVELDGCHTSDLTNLRAGGAISSS